MAARLAAALIALAFLSACAPTVATEAVYTPEIYDQARYTADVNICRGWALKDHAGFSPKAIASAGAKGAAQNAGSAAVNVLIPIAGAAGGIVYESLEELGLTDLRQQRVFIKCVDRKTEWDRSALEIEPSP